MFRVFICASILYITGCSQINRNIETQQLTYFKDYRTGLCFAWFGFGESRVMTNVPCDTLGEQLFHANNPQ